MKIAIISIVFPYPINSGGSVAMFNMIDYLRRKNDITLICPNIRPIDVIELKEVWPNVKILTTPRVNHHTRAFKLYRWILKTYQLLRGFKQDYFYPKTHLSINNLSQYNVPDFLKLVQDETSLNKYDLIQVEFAELIGLVNFLPKHLKKVFVHHELRYRRLQMEYDTLKIKNLADQYHIAATKDLEISLLNKYDKVLTVTETDKEYLKNDGVNSDLLYTSTLPIVLKHNNVNEPFRFNNTFVFLGPESHYPNLDGINWFLETCWDRILDKHPNLKLKIISKWSNKFKAIHKNKKKIEFVGFVEDLSQVFEGAIMIVPLRIVSGMRMKILEGISWKMPIISTVAGAEGLPIKDGTNGLLARNENEFVQKTLELIDSSELMQKLINESQLLLTNDYFIEKCGETRNKIYQSFE
jgi:glycosyltransferase involved in cell wall biosynthesis